GSGLARRIRPGRGADRGAIAGVATGPLVAAEPRPRGPRGGRRLSGGAAPPARSNTTACGSRRSPGRFLLDFHVLLDVIRRALTMHCSETAESQTFLIPSTKRIGRSILRCACFEMA